MMINSKEGNSHVAHGGYERGGRRQHLSISPLQKCHQNWQVSIQDNNDSQTWHKKSSHERKLTYSDLIKLSNESAEPEKIVEAFGDQHFGLGSLLSDGSYDIQELVLVTMGIFFQKRGATQFFSSFIEFVQKLAEKQIFFNITSIIMQLPYSQATDLPSKRERLKKLIESIYYASLDILRLMPTFGCNHLGQHFFRDLVAMKDLPAVCDLNPCETTFDIFNEVATLLDDTWERNAKPLFEEIDGSERLQSRAKAEVMTMMRPPDNFRLMSVVPVTRDLCEFVEPFLRPSIIEGKYPDAETYLDVQFRLLREDFCYPLRNGILEYKRQLKSNSKKLSGDIRLYFNVRIIEYSHKEHPVAKQQTTAFRLVGLLVI